MTAKKIESAIKIPRPSGVTLEDIAKAAEVSLATASRCLNRPESVRPEKRKRIFEAVERLNYVPHGAARALASKRTRMIGAVFPSLDNTLFGGALDTFQKTVAIAGYTVLIASSEYDPDRERTHIQNLLASGVEALLLVGAARDPAIYRLIDAMHVPYVLSWVYEPDRQHAYVGFDNAGAAAHLTDYLMMLGHRRFGVISGITDGNDRAQSRLRGIQSALADKALELDPECLFERRFSVEDGRNVFHLLMSMAIPPTAIICGSAPFAYGSLFEAAEMEIEVPDTVSVACFDDMWLAPHISPPLTTVRTPRYEMGEQAAHYLIAKLEGRQVVLPRALETKLVVRKSTGPAPTE